MAIHRVFIAHGSQQVLNTQDDWPIWAENLKFCEQSCSVHQYLFWEDSSHWCRARRKHLLWPESQLSLGQKRILQQCWWFHRCHLPPGLQLWEPPDPAEPSPWHFHPYLWRSTEHPRRHPYLWLACCYQWRGHHLSSTAKFEVQLLCSSNARHTRH